MNINDNPKSSASQNERIKKWLEAGKGQKESSGAACTTEFVWRHVLI